MDGWIDRMMDRQNDGQTDKIRAYRPLNGWICKKQSFSNRFCNFYKSITDRPTDRRMDGRMDGQTDKPSYRDATAASEKGSRKLS